MSRRLRTSGLIDRLPSCKAGAAADPALAALTYTLLCLAGLASAATFHVPGEYGTI